jgi:DNA-binding response OmpR family regulator
MNESSRVLIVDDESSVRVGLERLLRKEGLQVTLAASGKEALEAIEAQRPDVMILDLNMPDLSGNEVCKQVRKHPSASAIAILILTGDKTAGQPAECLNGGADDYLAKPVDLKELLARVRALLRRPRLYTTEDAVIQKGPVSLHVGERKVCVDGKEVPSFTPKEFELLRLLLLHAPQVMDNNALALKVWGVPSERLHKRTLNVHIQRIREKLGPQGAPHLKTVTAIGYQWLESA